MVTYFNLARNRDITSAGFLNHQPYVSHVVNYRVLSHDLRLHSKRVLKCFEGF